MVLVSYKPTNTIVHAGPIVIVMHFLQAGRKRATLPGTEESDNHIEGSSIERYS